MSKYLFIFSIVIIGVIGAYFHRAREAHYIYIGKYDYEIVDETLFRQTYLSESYGFLIGDLSIQGLQIKDLPYVSQKSDFIVSLNHPIRAAYKNSQGIHAEGIANTSQKPLEIIQDTTVFSKHIFVYQLFPEGKYRLLLP